MHGFSQQWRTIGMQSSHAVNRAHPRGFFFFSFPSPCTDGTWCASLWRLRQRMKSDQFNNEQGTDERPREPTVPICTRIREGIILRRKNFSDYGTLGTKIRGTFAYRKQYRYDSLWRGLPSHPSSQWTTSSRANISLTETIQPVEYNEVSLPRRTPVDCACLLHRMATPLLSIDTSPSSSPGAHTAAIVIFRLKDDWQQTHAVQVCHASTRFCPWASGGISI